MHPGEAAVGRLPGTMSPAQAEHLRPRGTASGVRHGLVRLWIQLISMVATDLERSTGRTTTVASCRNGDDAVADSGAHPAPRRVRPHPNDQRRRPPGAHAAPLAVLARRHARVTRGPSHVGHRVEREGGDPVQPEAGEPGARSGAARSLRRCGAHAAGSTT